MLRKFKPIIFIGLGKYGSEVAQNVFGFIGERYRDLSKIISCLVLNENGEFLDIRNGYLFKCDGMNLELSLGSFQRNYKIIKDYEKEFENILSVQIENVRRREILIELQEKGYDIGKNVVVILFSTLFDSIGSVSIIPFLGFTQCLLAGRLRGMSIENWLLGFFPDFFDEYKGNELAYARTYACLQEIDFIADHPQLISPEGQNILNFAYLFTGKNEEAVDLGSYKELIPLISETLFLLIGGEIASDISFSYALLNKVDGKTTRYSSLGLSKLVYPKDEILKALSYYLCFRILENKNIINIKDFDKEYINSDIKEFILKNNLDKLSESLRFDISGKSIWVDFKYKGVMNENVVVDNFISNIDIQAKIYEENEMTTYTKNLVLKRDQLFEEKTKNLINFLKERIDSEEKGIYYSKAFLDLFLNQKSDYIKGDLIDRAYNIDLVEKEAKSFFDKEFGIDKEREKAEKLRRDIDDKKEFLKKNMEELKNQDFETLNEDDLLIEKLKEKEKKIEDLKKEIDELTYQYEETRSRIEEFDFKILDPSERRNLLDSLEKEMEEERSKLINDLKEVDKNFKKEKDILNGLYEMRKKKFQKYFIVYPIFSILFVLIILSAISLIFRTPFLNLLDFVFFEIYPFAALVYVLIIASIYWITLKKLIDRQKIIVENLKNMKISLLYKIQQQYSKIYKTRFEHILYSLLLEWVKDYKDFVKKLETKLKLFIDELIIMAKNSKESWENFAFKNTLFIRSVVTKENLERFIERNMRLPLEIDSFFNKKRLSDYFEEFLENENLNNFVFSINDFTQDVFKGVVEKSIEDFLREEEAEGRIDISEKLYNLYISAKTYILLDIEKGMDKSSDIVYLGVKNPDVSYIKYLAEKQGYEIQFYDNGNNNEISIFKLKIGFPAFYIALIKYGHKIVSKFKNKLELYLAPDEWSVEDLFPSVYILGNEEDEVRRIACLGMAFGLIFEENDKFYFKDKELGNSYQEIIEFLKSYKGNKIRNILMRQIDQEKKKQDAIDRLVSYRESKGIDEIDRKIIDSVISEISPLG